jgi:hypothetical protein
MEKSHSFTLDASNPVFPNASKGDKSIIIGDENVLDIIIETAPGITFQIILKRGGTSSSVPFSPLTTKESFYIPSFFKEFSLKLELGSGSTQTVKGKLKTRIAQSQSEIPSDGFSIPR